MRSLTLAALGAFALVGCNGDDSAQNAGAAEENISNAVVPTNDVTAIDAATGSAANMAPDVPFLPNEVNAAEEASGNAASNSTRSAPRPRRPASRRPAAEPAAPEAAAETATTDTNSL